MITTYLGDGPRRVVDGVSAAIAVGTITNLLPHLAAIFTIVWTLIQIWETKTVQRVRRQRRLARAQAAAPPIVAEIIEQTPIVERDR